MATDNRPGKARDVLAGGLELFATDGYARASIDAIAAAANVSTRTIYNRFGDKAGLFRAVIVDSADRVAQSQLEIIDEHLEKVVDVEQSLRAFARAWVQHDPDTAQHFAIVRQVRAEIDHIPEQVIRAWQERGPLRVRQALASRLQRLAKDGHLHVDDADLAAAHLVQLVAGDLAVRSFDGARPLPRREAYRLAEAGASAFLRAYRPAETARVTRRTTSGGPLA